MKDSIHDAIRPTVRKANGAHHNMNEHRRRSTDFTDSIVPWKVSNLVKFGSALIACSFVVGTLYMNIHWRINTLECGQKMLIDVVVYKKQPEQPNCQ